MIFYRYYKPPQNIKKYLTKQCIYDSLSFKIMPKNNNNTLIIKLEWPRKLLFILAVGYIGYYLVWRATTLNPDAPILSTLLYVAELFGFITMLMHGMMLWRMTKREAALPEAGHSVDVFIPTINEPLAIIRRTALKAMAMDYAHQTWILDDGRRDEVKALAQTLGCGYITRPDNNHAKAGNLNHALAHTSGEFIAIFDADHAPSQHFLKQTLGYFGDAQVAFVQTPQDFYNLDSYQHRASLRRGKMWTEQSLFFRVIQRGKDAWNAAFFCGSCAVIRRSHLEAIGGFATGSITEDLHTSIRLHAAGYRSVYHAESLAYGIAAAQVEPFLRQRIRWGQGAMQVWRQERILTSPRLSWPQKICYLASILTYFEGWQKAIYYFTPVWVLTTGALPLIAPLPQFVMMFIPYIFLTFWVFSELGRGYSRTSIAEQYNMIRFAAFAYATLGLLRGNLHFRVTNKAMQGRNSHQWFLAPQYMVLGGNAIAGGLALGAFHLGLLSETAPGLLVITGFWAAFNAVLAAMVILFSQGRMRFKRGDYRFRLPLTATLSIPGHGQVPAMVADLSSTGMQLKLETATGLTKGQILQGNLRLPGHAVPFTAQIRRLNRLPGSMAESIGCVLINDALPLEAFLYGSDLEWRMHELSERDATLLERALPEAFSNADVAKSHGVSAPWVYRQLGQDAVLTEPGLFAFREAGMADAGVFAPLPVGVELEGQVYTAQGWQQVHGRVLREKRVIQADQTIYWYELEGGLGHGMA